MNRVSRIFNPYSLLIIGVFIEYYPTYFNNPQPVLKIGSVSFYIIDISFIFLCLYAFFSLLVRQTSLSSRGGQEGRSIQVIFGLFIAFNCIKWLLQSDHDIFSIRLLANYSVPYAFLLFFPMLVRRKEGLRNLQYLLIIFLIYIFILHIYAFSIRGYQMHILSGNFLTMLSLLYFLALTRNHVLALSSIASFCVKALVITTFVMVGHRSGFIGILLGLITLLFFNKRLAVKEVTALMVVGVIGAGVAIIASPDLFSKLSERASTTFDTSQETYQGRYYQLFLIPRIAMEEHPLIGKPLTSKAMSREAVSIGGGNTSISQEELVVTPHNLVLEWLYYYGSIGLLLGLTLVIMGAKFIKRFLVENKNDKQNYQMGVAILCCMVHNLFFALSNVTVMSSFGTFFLYFPLIILVSINRNKQIFYK